MAHLRLITSTLVMTGTIALAISLTGCGSNPIDNAIDSASDQVAENGAEKIIEGLGGGDMDIEFESLPEGFPESVPLVSENIVLGATVPGEDGEGDAFSVSVTDDRDPATVAEQVKSDFSGWEEITPWSDTMLGGGFTKGEWGVIVGVMPGDSDSDSIVGYTVIPQTD
jgi:hypothetical protein